MYKIIALDLDGTLVKTDKSLPEENKEVLQMLAKKGVKIVLASGRPTQGIKHLATELGLFELGGYILSYNGGRLLDCSTNEIIYNQPLDRELACKVYDRAKEFNLCTMCYDETSIFTDTPDHKYVNHEARLTKIPVVAVKDFKTSIPFGNVKVLLAEEPEYVASIIDEFKEPFMKEMNIYRSDPFYIECVTKGIDKAKTLKRLCEITGVKQEEMIAFGDGYNDGSMIEFAGCGVAMKNAVDEVKQVANEITEFTNDESGVAKHLLKMIEENRI